MSDPPLALYSPAGSYFFYGVQRVAVNDPPLALYSAAGSYFFYGV